MCVYSPCMCTGVHACEDALLILFNACNYITCVLNVCQTRSECGSDMCVIELVAGLYHRLHIILMCAFIRMSSTLCHIPFFWLIPQSVRRLNRSVRS